MDDRQQRFSEELARVEFEFFKHMSTLSGAAVLGGVAIYRELVVERLVLSLALLSFALAAVTAIWGMALVRIELRRLSLEEGVYRNHANALAVVCTPLVGGIMLFLVNTPVMLLNIFVAAVAVSALGLILVWSIGQIRNS